MKNNSIETASDKKTTRNAWFLGSSSLLNDAGGDMIAPILPFYITALGGGGVALGLLSGLREGLSSVFKIFGGWFSDRIGKRKPFVFFGYLFSFIFKFFIGIANTWSQVLWFVSLERFGKFRDAPRDAIIAQHLRKRFLGGSEISQCTKKPLLDVLWATWPQVRENFLKPDLIEGILMNK